MPILIEDDHTIELPNHFTPQQRYLFTQAYSELMITHSYQNMLVSNATISGYIVLCAAHMILGFFWYPPAFFVLSIFLSPFLFGLLCWTTLYFSRLYRELRFHQKRYGRYVDLMSHMAYQPVVSSSPEPTTMPSLPVVLVEEVRTARAS